MKVIHLSESRFNNIFEENTNVPFETFYENMLEYIRGLLNKPLNTRPSDTLLSIGLTDKKLRTELSNYGIIEKNENIKEPYDEESNKNVSRYYVSYKVHRDNFKDKLRKLYNDLVKNKENE